ncbi:hypothetical protein BC828DRAFT_397752 [Blastocladiella britannica]|nr:hypothetical protein BC828DRAFT_397752 [Blastocladiella britannica]
MASYTPAPSDIAYQRELTIQTATVFFSVSGGALFLVAIACCAGRCYLYRRRNNARNAILPVGSRGGSRVHNDGLSSSMMTEAIRQAMDDSDATARGSRSALVHKGAGHGQGTGEPPVLKTADVSLHSLRKQLSRRSSAELSSVVHYNEHGEVQTVGALSLGKDAVATAISTLASALPVAAVATLAVAPSSNLPVPQINTILATPITSPIAQRNRLPNSASSPSSPGASSVTAALLHSTGYFRNNNSSGNGGHTSSNNYNDSIGKDMVSLMKHSSSHLRLSVSANGSVSQGSLSQGSGLRLASSASRVMLPSAGSLFLDPTPYDAAATTPSAANGGAPRGADSSPSAAAAVPAGDMIYPVLHVEPSPDQNIESAPLPTKNSPPPPLPQSASEFCEVVAADDSWWIPAHSIAVDFDTALGEDGYQSTHFAKITDKDLVLAHCHVISPPPGSAGKTGEPVSLVVILASASTDNLVAPRGRGLWEFVRKRRDQLAPLPSSSSPLGSPTEMTDAVECWLPHMVVTLWAQEIQLLRYGKTIHFTKKAKR